MQWCNRQVSNQEVLFNDIVGIALLFLLYFYYKVKLIIFVLHSFCATCTAWSSLSSLSHIYHFYCSCDEHTASLCDHSRPLNPQVLLHSHSLTVLLVTRSATGFSNFIAGCSYAKIHQATSFASMYHFPSPKEKYDQLLQMVSSKYTDNNNGFISN